MDTTESNPTETLPKPPTKEVIEDTFKDPSKTNPIIPRKEIKLATVKNLLRKIEENSHAGLRELVANHTFVGCADREFALLQHATKLFVVNIGTMTQHLFYQLMLMEFGNASVIKLNPPAEIKEMALIALEYPEAGWTQPDGSKEDLAEGE